MRQTLILLCVAVSVKWRLRTCGHYVFVVREHRVLALVNNMYMLEGKTKCLHLLHLCVERRVDRVIALIICVLVVKGDQELAIIYIICVFVVRGVRVLVLCMCYVWERETECLHSLILCVSVCGKGFYCLHQLILHVLLGTGQAVIITACLKGDQDLAGINIT